MSYRAWGSLALLVVLLVAGNTNAQAVPVIEGIAAFRQMIDVAPSILVPTVVQVPLSGTWLERQDVAVLDQTTHTFVPTLFRQEVKQQAVTLTATYADDGNLGEIVDNNPATYTHFDLPPEGQGSFGIYLDTDTPATFSGLSTILSPNVALPTSIEIRTGPPGAEKIIVARQPMTTPTIRFPATTATTWRINFTHGQPLRIAELKLLQDDVATSTTQYARFLAHPGHGYRVYLDADRLPTDLQLGEAPNLQSDTDVVVLPGSSPQPNPAYSVADVDADGVPDLRDNCVTDANPDQADLNTNGRGDVCDDFDKDGVINEQDNCPDNPNRNQTDTDGDKMGDACDSEESRLTEANPWLPWAGLGIAAIVVIGLFALTVRSMASSGDQNHPDEPSDSDAGATPPAPGQE